MLAALSAPLFAEQTAIVPLPDLYRQLDQRQEWVVLPLADWRELQEKIRRNEQVTPTQGAPAGAWLEHGRVQVEVIDDRELRCTATLTAVAVQEGPQRCPLFTALPAQMGAPLIGGTQALLVQHAAGADLLLPGAGRHAVTITWTTALDGGDASRRIGTLVLPRLAGCALTVRSAHPGIIADGPFAAQSDSTWTLAGPVAPLIPFQWLPGRDRTPQATVLGLAQHITAHLDDAGCRLEWSAKLDVLRGSWPASLDVRLPAGWRFTAHGKGINALRDMTDGVRLELAPQVADITCTGWCPADAAIALPSVAQALVQGGVVALKSELPCDYALPALWKNLDAQPGMRKFLVPGPDAGMQVRLAGRNAQPTITSTAHLLLGPEPERWRLQADLSIGACERFALTLRLPAGWRLLRFTGNTDLRLDGLAPGDEHHAITASRTMTLSARSGFITPHQVRAELERLTTSIDTVEPLRIDEAQSSVLSLAVSADSGIATTITASPRWRLDDQIQPANTALRTTLRASDDAEPVRIAASVRPPACQAEAVVALQPSRDRTWGRCDLRLTISAGHGDTFMLALPFLTTPNLTASHDTTRWELTAAGDGRFQLRSLQPWQGERLLRLEGPLAAQERNAFPVPTLTCAGVAVPLRLFTVLHAASDGDVVVERGTGWRDADVDDLPSWSGLIPGEPVVAVLRRQPVGPADGQWRIERHPLAKLPAAFIDRLELRTRIARDGQRTVARFLLAAPELQTLALGLPAGCRFIEATIDGVLVAPRRMGDDLHLPLPGRTQVQVALLYAADATPRHLHVAPPRLGGLAVTRSTWTAGVDQALAAFPLDDPAVMPLTSTGPRWTRLWFATWMPPAFPLICNDGFSRLSSGKTLAAALQDAADPRALAPQQQTQPPRGEPELELPAQRFTGSRLGGTALLALTVVDGETLRLADRWGVALALLLALACTWLGSARGIAAALIAAPSLACALHGWQVQGGPLLAASEWLAPFLLGAVILRWLRRRFALSTGTATTTAIFTALIMATLAALFTAPSVFGGEETTPPVLMGYERLDEAGLPTGVRVALPRERFTALWNRAHPTAVSATPVCALATGAPLIDLSAGPGRITGHLRLAFAVPDATWQTITLPLPAGVARACATTALGEAPVPAVAWRQDQRGLILDLPPRSQGVVTVELELPVTGRDGRWTSSLPLPALPGGTLCVQTASEWRLTVNDQAGAMGAADTWRWDLPAAGGSITILLTRAEAAAAASAARLTLAQQLTVRLMPDHLDWRATADCTGMPERTSAITLPERLVLSSIEGEGLADWRQDGRQALLHWRTAADQRHLLLRGLIPRANLSEADLALSVPGALRSTGRIELSHGAGARFAAQAPATLMRDHPRDGGDLAWKWEDDAGGLHLRWDAESVELRGAPRAAVLVGIDRVRCWRSVRLAGRGGVDAITWSLPAPWQVEDARLPAIAISLVGDGATRRAVLRSPRGAWRAGDTVQLLCSAGRRELGARITLPEALPAGDHLALDRARWLVGGAGDGGLRLADAAVLTLQPLADAGTGLPDIFPFAPGERWLFAGLAGTQSPVLVEEPVATRAEVAADHYLVLAQDRLRWWARLTWTISAGILGELRCRLPAGAQLSALRCRDLGSWTQEGGEVIVRLSAPTRTSHVLELDLEQALVDGTARLAPPVTPWPMQRNRVALVDEDGTGLVHLDPQGLVAAEAADAGGLPPGLAASAVPNRWRAERTNWTLDVRRETVGETGGADGVVTLVDGQTTVTSDGELRSRAAWHLLNRTRTRLALVIPDGVELWEVQVDGRPVRPREDATASSGSQRTVHVPVTPLRPGAAATRLALTWKSAPAADGRIRLRPPHFSGLTVVQVAWRCSAPDGWRLTRRSGGLEEAEDAAVANLKVQRVLDDVSRLNRLGNLSDNGLRRQAEELAILDQELNDHLTALENLAPASLREQGSFLSSAKVQRSEVSKARDYNRDVFSNRAGRRKQLQMDNQQLNWARNEAPVAVVAPVTLGPGQAPPGWRAAGGGALLGVELIPAPTGRILALRGQGADLSADLALEREAGRRWPWLVLIVGAVLAGGVLFVRRRG